MIRLIETKNFRCLKYISQPLGNFHVLVGANASGKTTFLDVVGFVADIVSNGVDFAITQRSPNYLDLVFGGKQEDIELAIELEIPEQQRQLLSDNQYQKIRYEVRIGLMEETMEHAIKDERVLLLHHSVGQYLGNHKQPRLQFPEYFDDDAIIVNRRYPNDLYKTIVKKQPNGNDNFYPEIKKNGGKAWQSSFKLGTKKSALGNLPADETNFPVASWLKNYLNEGVQMFILDSLNIRKSSPPGQTLKFKPDGSNLPWVVENLKKSNMDAYHGWIKHLRTALPDIQEVLVFDLPDVRHRYLKVRYSNGIEVPSWLVSDGTLRLLALTLCAYLPDFEGTYLIEEPENGVHPRAIETVFQSLSSVYGAQILLATHSPVILSMVEPKDVLCFKKVPAGMTDIVKGDEHPDSNPDCSCSNPNTATETPKPITCGSKDPRTAENERRNISYLCNQINFVLNDITTSPFSFLGYRHTKDGLAKAQGFHH